MDDLSLKSLELYGEEQDGEGYIPKYICMKRQIPEEEICESEISSCSGFRTTTGNILDRMITDPYNRRPVCLEKWPTYPPKAEAEIKENPHQFRAAHEPTTIRQMCSLRITSDPNRFRLPTIIATIGMNSYDNPSILELLEAGAEVLRINMAHADPCYIEDPFKLIIEATNKMKMLRDFDIPVTVMMELKGPEMRTGKIDEIVSFRGCYQPFFRLYWLLRRVKKLEVCVCPMPMPMAVVKGEMSGISLSNRDVHMNRSSFPEVYIKENTNVTLTTDKLFKDKCSEKVIYIDYPDLARQMSEGMQVFISDGLIRLKVTSTDRVYTLCNVEMGGRLKNNQKVYIPSFVSIRPNVTEFDHQCLKAAAKLEVDVVVVPKTRNAEIIKYVKKKLGELQEEKKTLVFAKISNFEGLENIDEILRVADGIIVQKNDLCLEICPEKMFVAQKEIIGKCNRAGKPVFCTAQLSSYKKISDITRRIEMSDIGGAIVDGADGIIITKETALGDEGVEIIKELSTIMREAEACTMQMPYFADLTNELNPSIEPNNAIALTAVQIANKIEAAALLVITTSGRAAQLLSWFRPRRPIIAISRVGSTARQLNLWRGVFPLHFTAPVHNDWFHDVKARFEYGVAYGKNRGIIRPGDLLILVSGWRKNAGFTNCIRVVFAAPGESFYGDNVSNYYQGSEETIMTV